MKNRKIQQHTSILWLLFGVFMCAVISTSAADEVKMGEVPKEVQDAIDEYLKDTTGRFSINMQKQMCRDFDIAIQQVDIEAETPIPVYKITFDMLLHGDINLPLKKLVVPVSRWYVPIKAHDKYIYYLWISSYQGPFEVVGTSCSIPDSWKKVLEKWSQNSEYKPVFIMTDGFNEYVHFPQKDDYNFTSLHRPSDSYLSDGKIVYRYNILSDSRDVLKKIKKRVYERIKRRDGYLQKEEDK